MEGLQVIVVSAQLTTIDVFTLAMAGRVGCSESCLTGTPVDGGRDALQTVPTEAVC